MPRLRGATWATLMKGKTDARLRSYTIEDDPSEHDQGAVEVTIELEDGRHRWCFFFTPEGLRSCGDWIDGTQIPMHLGVPWMIVVAELSEEIIDRVLLQLEREGLLEEHTMAIEG